MSNGRSGKVSRKQSSREIVSLRCPTAVISGLFHVYWHLLRGSHARATLRMSFTVCVRLLLGSAAEAVDLTAELERGLSVTEAEDDVQLTDMSSTDEKREATDEEVAIAAAVNDMTTTHSSSRLKKGWIEDVRVGMQSNLRLFITNVASVFTARAPAEFLDHQVDLSIHVLNFLQTLARDVALDRCTW